MISSSAGMIAGLGAEKTVSLVDQFNKAANINPKEVSAEEGFAGLIKDHLDKTSEAQHLSKTNNLKLQMGDPTMTLEKSVITSSEASLQFSSLLSTRNKLMEAYRDVINMPV